MFFNFFKKIIKINRMA